ncbi:hypothetical protein [Micromonospora narathiwatensis]|uniref:Dynamin family protein n=1 Tax=Micromonospora narathiwatensis TaxID=299146 RepID=A0A1A8ZB69_9ACTN|nr:hypothetical protein [Micromonospora narathiwatensis]SBT41053.1 hypothetical protein GA0070621_1128 [Micromonospora narathiwatensis]
MDTSARWAEIATELYQNRLRWATETYDRFLADLAPAIRRELPSARPRVTASLYGETQVGKTTLLLTLLGVDPDRMEEIGDTLRAGRPAGMSATPTATRYRAAATDRWTWRVDPEEAQELTEDEMRKRIAEVRDAVERGRWPLDRVVEIGLPISCFRDRDGTAIDVLDLPGVNAVNAQEDRHARLLLDTWVTASDVVILVALVNHLPPLRPAALGIEALRHWPRQLSKFRVVLTYAYSNLDTSEWLDTVPPEERTLPALRSDIRAAFDVANWPKLERSDLSWLYPLEFGKSWSTLVADDAGHPAIELRDEALHQLRQDLAQSVRPINRLRRAFEAKAVAESVRATRSRELDQAVESADLDVRRQKKRRQRLVAILEQVTAELADLAEAEHRVAAVGPVAFTAPPLPDTGSRREPPDITKAERDLNDAFRRHWSAWRQEERRLRDSLPATVLASATGPIRDTVPARIGPIIETRFAAIRDRASAKRAGLFGRMSGRYHRRLTADLVTAYRNASGEIAGVFDRGVWERISAIRREIAETTSGYEVRRRRLETSLTDTEQAIVAATDTGRRRRKRRDRERDALDEHVRVAGEFPARLDARYRERRAELIRAVAAATDPLEAFGASLAVLDCARAYDTIRHGR